VVGGLTSPQVIHHPLFGLTRASALEVSDDPDEQVASTIDLMARYVREDASSPEVMADAQRAVQGGIGGFMPCFLAKEEDAIEDIFRHVKGRVNFAEDEEMAAPISSAFPIVEILIRPRDLLTLCQSPGSAGCRLQEDCDGFSMYTAALLRARGIESRFVTIAADPDYPERFSHVYVAAYTSGGRRIPLDTSHGAYPGWEAPNRYRIQEWPIDGGGLRSLLELALLAAGTYWLLRNLT
jgi:hypothetical protein